ncbi:MAG: hypothetical protein CTY16_11110 [Methylobacter sp.]|nr:MAG: hypothetical protein CTY16_11110 [Methylobacter sp.]
MTLQPNTIGNPLIEAICRYIKDDATPSEFEVARLKREAAKLKSRNLACYANIMGMIAYLDNDLMECKKQHELAIRLDPSVEHYEAYCTSLNNFGRFQDAYNWAQQSLKLFPHAPNLLLLAVKYAYLLGLFDKVVEHYQALIPLQLVGIEQEAECFFHNAKRVLRLGIPESSLHKLSNILESIRLKHDASIKKINLSLIQTEETQGLFNWIETTSDVDTTVEMNMELCELLASQSDIDLGNMIVAFRACQH